MKVVVFGLWHLGCVTAACLSRHHRIIGLDTDTQRVASLQKGIPPIYEPGLAELIASNRQRGHLDFSTDTSTVADADVVWICHDTPVDSDDRSDVDWVLAEARRILPRLRSGAVVLISSQLPVGTCAKLTQEYPQAHFACSPENLRLGKALDAFDKPARIIVGAPDGAARAPLDALLAPIGAPIIWMKPESAEMVKHALNSFLALSISYINEIATLSEFVSADAMEVAAGLKSDPRIGIRAYLSPGGPFAGGTLARDVVTLAKLGESRGQAVPVIAAIKESNDRHRLWALRRIKEALPTVSSPTIALIGLAYTTGTNTLRRSAAVELYRQLVTAGAKVRAFDPLISQTDENHRDITLSATVADAVLDADALIVCTEYPELRELNWPALISSMGGALILDANRFLEKFVAALPEVTYITVGRS